MPKPIIWSPLSENDFENILNYLHKNWGNKVAAHFIDLTEDILNQISINPKQFPICYKRKKVRKCVLTKQNAIFYRDGKAIVEILRIFDTRQDPNTLTFK
jgi:plasmid stabilization system protein ParE